MTNPEPDHRMLQAMDTLYNIRDLGGHPTQHGQKTQFFRFVRSDAPVRLSQSDQERLLAYPIRQIIDLRSLNEVNQQPNSLKDHPLVQYVHIPLLGPSLEQDMMRLQKDQEKDIELVDLYLYILDHSKPAVARVLKTMLGAKEGAVLFHCTHGKDRTGLIAALLLSLAGVDKETIVSDYSLSESKLQPWFDTFIHNIPKADRRFFTTPARYMEQTLKHIEEQYGSIEEYLRLCGLSQKEQSLLKKRLLDS